MCGIGFQQSLQKEHSGIRIQLRCAQSRLLTCQQVQSAKEVDRLPAWVQAYKCLLATCMPHNR